MDRGPVGARPHVVLEHILLVLEHTVVCFFVRFEVRLGSSLKKKLEKKKKKKKKRKRAPCFRRTKKAKRTVEVELRRPGVGLALERVLCDDRLSSSSAAAAVRGVLSLLLAVASARGRAATAASVEYAGESGLAFGRRRAHGKGRARLFFL